MGWQEEFIETFYEVVKQENTIFSRFSKNMNKDEWSPRSVVNLTERQWQYLLFKGLLTNNYFDEWVIQLEQAYSPKRHAQARRLHADFMLSKIKYREPDYDSTICVEMKRGFRGAGNDCHRLTQNANPNHRGLLVFQFLKNPVELEGKINESPEFSRRKFNKMATPGDIEINVVSVGGNHERYHFEAVLLGW